MIKQLTEKQKKTVQSLKQKIIDSDHYITKYKTYFKLLKRIKRYHKVKKSDIRYKDNIFIDYKIDNVKISARDTIIFSIQPALICYSGIKNYCQLYKNKKCYALKNELQYFASVLYKERQRIQFKKLKAWQLARYFIRIKAKYPNIKYLRINESGELTKKSIQKLNVISDILKKYNIKVYSYTHNTEIKKENITSENLTINSSNKNIKLCNRFLSYDKLKIDKVMQIKKSIKFKRCIADCSKCKLCTSKKDITILCNIH